MRPAIVSVVTTAATAAIAAVLVIGCGSTPAPSAAVHPSETVEAIMPLPSDAITGQLGGPWRRSPIVLDEPHIAIVSDACAVAAREELGETEANLPTAVVDARGEGFVTAILADDLDAIECLARLDETGLIATVDSVARLSTVATAPVDGTKFSVASLIHLDDRPGGRTVAFGRIGPAADSAKVGFDDASVILGSSADGWWAMWWQGTVRASSYSAVDKSDIVVGNTKPFEGEREARVAAAAWWLDPAAPTPEPGATSVRALVQESACASGRTPEGRIEPPRILETGDVITVTYEIRHLPGAQDCQGNAPFPVVLDLPSPLGDRSLLDGGETPARDASKAPG